MRQDERKDLGRQVFLWVLMAAAGLAAIKIVMEAIS